MLLSIHVEVSMVCVSCLKAKVETRKVMTRAHVILDFHQNLQQYCRSTTEPQHWQFVRPDKMAIRTASTIRILQTLSKQSVATQTFRLQNSTPRLSLECRTPRQAFVPVRWHSTPSNSPRVYEYNDIKQLSESPSSERVIIGESSREQQ